MYQDKIFMHRCLELAAIAKYRGKTAVGSIIVRDNNIIAEAEESHEGYPAMVAHAEIVAVIKATEILGTKDLGDCTLYTTVEPCLMCSFVIRETKIGRVVFGVTAGEIGGSNPEFPLLTTQALNRWPHKTEIKGGVLEAECRAMLYKEK